MAGAGKASVVDICFLIVLLAVMTTMQFFAESAKPLLMWSRALIANGEWWRLVTGNFMHISWPHLLLNLLGYALLAALFGFRAAIHRCSIVVPLLAALVGIELYFLADNIQWYVGFSGVLVGLFVYMALMNAAASRLQAIVVLIIVLVKVAREQWLGSADGGLLGSGFPVVFQAHLYGAVDGVVFAAVAFAAGFSKKRSATTCSLNG